MNVSAMSEWIDDKVAPAPLIAVQAFADSHESEDEDEKLSEPERARDWLVGFGLAAPTIEIGPAELETLVEFRRCLRALVGANTTGEPDQDANAELAEMAARRPVPVTVATDGSVTIDLDPADTVDGLIAQLIGIVLRSQIEDTWGRLKICAADTCRWAFYDSSKNRGGHWCSMELCGNRVKNRTYRERRSTAK